MKDMIDRCEFDTIYHEHLCYFSLTALDALVRAARACARRRRALPIHGGSLRLLRRPRGAASRPTASSELLARSERWASRTPRFYRGFARRVDGSSVAPAACSPPLQRERTTDRRLRRGGQGQHAPELLRHRPETLDFVVDRSTHKQGRYMPGVRDLRSCRRSGC